MDTDRHQLYREFQKHYPLEKLHEMTLEEYANCLPADYFCNWVERKTRKLGSIQGANAYKFGIFRYGKQPSPGQPHDDTYAWQKGYGAADAQSAYEIVHKAIIDIANAARNHDLDKIESIDTLSGMFKWKVAFLYSEEWIIPINSIDWLRNLCVNFGMSDGEKATIAESQRFLIDRRGSKDIWDYTDELVAIHQKMDEAKPHRVWLYAPGEGASQWNRCVDEGIMALGWDDMEDLSQFASREDIVAEMRKVYNKPNGKFRNDSLALWEFAHVIKPGDIVYAKKGLYKVVGRGIVEGDYEYLDDVGHYRNVRKVKWTHEGEWDAPHQQVQKTLTDISKYPTYVEDMEKLFDGKPEEVAVPKGGKFWMLIANPKIYTFADKPVGTKETWTLYTDNGKKRSVFADMEAAREGDSVICYDSNPTKRIVAFARVIKHSDGTGIEFEKTESLLDSVTWQELKENPNLANVRFVKSPMGVSFCGLTEDESNEMYQMIRAKNPAPELDKTIEPYSSEDFLKDVFMTSEDYDRLKSLLLVKKNVILQGAPGVGKTFSAKRLAYSIMEEKDESRIEMVQFHQNYSYEDFIMGFKPNENGGFAIEEGRFYKFCKKAELDPKRPYFFIIDEINRGNLSKIFGELLMLIENDYRDHRLKLAYRDEEFSVPANLHIIGMMNTADRSLAMIDYALRRRFSFFGIKPGFESKGFKDMLAEIDNETLNNVIEGIVALNDVISKDDSLGCGFCIGHSYFCFKTDEPFDEMKLRNVVDFDIEPMLKEYWFDNQKKYESEINKLKTLTNS